MIALNGIGKFPVFHNPTGSKILGILEIDREAPFYKYATQVGTKGITIAINQLQIEDMVRRLVIDYQAINPADHERRENVPHGVYTYPSTKYEKTINNALCLGIVIKSRRLLFYPMLVLRSLEREEVSIVRNITSVKNNDIPQILRYLEELDFYTEQSMYEGDYVLRIRDNVTGQNFGMLVAPDGRYIESNICFYPHREMYLLEVLLMMRESPNAYVIYGEHGYRWLQ